ncbi:MAG: hypothetical protein O3C23_00790 [bacterium]|nr:hypothetical protein [bacterium]
MPSKRRSSRSRGKDASKPTARLPKKPLLPPQDRASKKSKDSSQKEVAPLQVSALKEPIAKQDSRKWVDYFDPKDILTPGLCCQEHPKEAIKEISESVAFCRVCFQVLSLQGEPSLQQSRKRGFLQKLRRTFFTAK